MHILRKIKLAFLCLSSAAVPDKVHKQWPDVYQTPCYLPKPDSWLLLPAYSLQQDLMMCLQLQPTFTGTVKVHCFSVFTSLFLLGRKKKNISFFLFYRKMK